MRFKHTFSSLFFSILFFASSFSFAQALTIGDGSGTVLLGDQFFIRYEFSATETEAQLQFFGDMTGVSTLDSNWLFLPIEGTIFDNGPRDLNDTVGIWEGDLSFIDAPLSGIVNVNLAVVAGDAGGADTAYYNVIIPDEVPVANVSGIVDNPPSQSGLVIIAQETMLDSLFKDNRDKPLEIVTLTKEDGSFMLNLPTFDPSGNDYRIFSNDYLFVLPTQMIPPQPVELTLFPEDNITDLTFSYTDPTAFISGHVSDNTGASMPNVQIGTKLRFELSGGDGGIFGKGDGPGPEISVRTDENGDYVLGVFPGVWGVGVNLSDTPYDGQFMEPPTKDSVRVHLQETVSGIDFMLYPADAMISGTVMWGEYPAPDIDVYAWSDTVGGGSATTDENGYYEIPVNSGFTYWVGINRDMLPPDINITPPEYRDATPGDWYNFTIGGNNFNAAVEGIVLDATTQAPVEGALVFVHEQYIKDGGGDTNRTHPFEAVTDSSGFYHINIPYGDFGITVEALRQGYARVDSFFSVWSDTTITMNFFLYPTIPGIVTGIVAEAGTGAPIDSALVGAVPAVWIMGKDNGGKPDSSEFPPFFTFTDPTGFYELEVPEGDYFIVSGADGFAHQFYDHKYDILSADVVTVHGLDTLYEINFDLEPAATLSGMVFTANGDTVRGGDVVALDTSMAYNYRAKADMEFYTGINPDGSYFFDNLPPGTYYIGVFAEGFEPQFYNLADYISDATPIDVTPGANITGIDFALKEFTAAPDLFAVEDIPMDQGLQVQLLFKGSSFDTPMFRDPNNYDMRPSDMYGYINRYTVWRAIGVPDTGSVKAIPSFEDLLKSDKKLDANSKYQQDGLIWNFIAEIPAVMLPVYGYVAPTLHDSSAFGPGISIFAVVAHDDEDGWFFPSKPAAGYSVDNLKPHVPANVLVQLNNDKVDLSWDAVDDPDLIYYRIYKSETPGFTPGSENLLTETEDVSFTDANYTSGNNYYYIVSAVDDAFNESFSQETPVSVTGVEDEGIPTDYEVYQNYPNPFNPTTTIRFGLPKAANVSVEIFNILGEKVATLVNGAMDAGYHRVSFDATNLTSGMYIYKVTAGDFKEIKKMMLMK